MGAVRPQRTVVCGDVPVEGGRPDAPRRRAKVEGDDALGGGYRDGVDQGEGLQQRRTTGWMGEGGGRERWREGEKGRKGDTREH